MLKFLFTLFGYLLIAVSSTGQECRFTLQLRLLDDHSKEALAGATVQRADDGRVWQSNSEGKVLITGLCAGKYLFTISHIGCETRSVDITITGNTAREILFHHVKVELGEVSITGVRQGETGVKEDLRGMRLFATRGLNLAQSLEAVNGVRTLNTGATIGKPVIHGLHSNRIVLVNQGVRLESQQWGTDHAPEIDPYSAEKFSVIKGAASVRYGAEAIGGVVLAEPRSLPHEKGLQGELNLAAFSNNGMGVFSGLLEGANGKKTNLGWRVQGTLKKGGSMRTPGYRLANTAMDEGNFSAALGLQKNQWNWDASLTYFSTTLGFYPGAHVDNVDDLNAAINSPVPLFKGDFSYDIQRPSQQARHWMAKAGTRVLWNSRHSSSLWVAHQENHRDEFDARSFNLFPELSLNMGTTSAEMMHTIEPGNGWVWQQGLTGSFQQNVNNPSSARIFVRNFESLNLGAFALGKRKKGSFTHEAGIRYDYKTFESFYRNNGVLTVHERRFGNLTATAGTHFQPGGPFEATFNLASAWRPPAPNELYANGLHQGLAAVEIGNQDFAAEKAINANLQLLYKKDSTLRIELTLYNNYIRDFIYLQPALPPQLTINGYYPRFEYRQANANLTGMDLLATWEAAPGWEWYGRMNLLYARNLREKDWLIWMPADRYETGITWSPPVTRRFTKPYLKASFAYTVTQQRVPGKSGWNDYAPPPPAYGLLGLEAGAIITRSKINAGISVYNLTNRSYRDYMNRFRYFADEAGINIALRLKVPLHFHKS